MLYLRKTYNFGPFRINITKSGVADLMDSLPPEEEDEEIEGDRHGG